MKTAYIVEQGAQLRRDGPVLRVCVGGKRKAEFSVHDLDQLVLMGNIMVTPRVLDLLIEERVDTVFLSLHGRYRGRLLHEYSKNVQLRLSQYQRLTDPRVALGVARAIVGGKIANLRTFLMKSARRQGLDTPELRKAVVQLRALGLRVESAGTLDQVRGCEGRAAAVYFAVFGQLLRNSDFDFAERNRRPPLDPVNVMLSLGYTLLANAVETAVHVVGLDPYLGALHEVSYGRPSLVCDLMEEYRGIIIDPVVVAAINRRSLGRDDFEAAADGGPVRMKRAAMRWFVTLVEKRLRSEILYEPAGKRFTYRYVIEQQVRHFARFILGIDDRYAPFTVR